jgi:hypothetical protein
VTYGRREIKIVKKQRVAIVVMWLCNRHLQAEYLLGNMQSMMGDFKYQYRQLVGRVQRSFLALQDLNHLRLISMQSTWSQLANDMAAWQGWRHMTTASSKALWVEKNKKAPF